MSTESFSGSECSTHANSTKQELSEHTKKCYRKTKASIAERSKEIREEEAMIQKMERLEHREERKPTHKKKATEKYKALFDDDGDIDDDGGDDSYDPAIVEYDGPELRKVVLPGAPSELSTERVHERKASTFSGKSDATPNDSAISCSGSSVSSSTSEDGSEGRKSLPDLELTDQSDGEYNEETPMKIGYGTFAKCLRLKLGEKFDDSALEDSIGSVFNGEVITSSPLKTLEVSKLGEDFAAAADDGIVC